jgi:anti-anti-sigma factor
MTDDAGRRRPDQSGSPGGRIQGAGAGTGGGQEPPVLEQVFDGDSLYALRAAAAAHAAQAGLPDGRVGDLALAVHELAANAVRHGAGHGRLRIWKAEDALRCEVSDDGPGGVPASGAAGSQAADTVPWNTEYGHGLWLIRQVADQASVRSGPGGTVAVVSFALGPPGRLPPFRLARRARDGCTILAAAGPLDLGSAGQLGGTVAGLARAVPALRLVLDLSGLTGWDSAGLAGLITAQERIDAHPGARMVVTGLPGHLRQRLRGAGLDSGFTWASTPAEALAILRRAT